ncbi:MAG: phosphoadenosine phosphosulfate reductase family protein [Fimbriiglobus sp.]
MIHIIPISGKDSLATALIQTKREPNLPYEYLFCDVGMELPETYEWLDMVEKHLGVGITRIGKSLEELMAENNMLPSFNTRFCTKLGKIFPIRDYLDGHEAVQYIGIRADEDDRAGKFVETDTIKVRFPLREQGIDINGVYGLLDGKGLLPPSFFWKRLYDDVMETLSDASRSWVDGLQPFNRHRLFSWRSRSNCYTCFYQRLYEWVGLLEFHPDLFERAEKLETDYGSGDRRTKIFTLRYDGPLKMVRNRAATIFKSRVDAVRQLVIAGRHSPQEDYMGQTSCGVYCGK